MTDPWLGILRQIDGLCAKFEAALSAGKRPDPARLLDRLPQPPGEALESDKREALLFSQARRRLLRELLLTELEYRAPAEHDAVITEWMGRFPDYADVIAGRPLVVMPVLPVYTARGRPLPRVKNRAPRLRPRRVSRCHRRRGPEISTPRKIGPQRHLRRRRWTTAPRYTQRRTQRCLPTKY